jgi:hypothetical protein
MIDPVVTAAPDDSYRPVSGLALAGLVVSGLFAILIAASLVVGIVKGTPIFFPIAIVLLAVVGFGLSYAGYRQILASEGTRVGVGVARLGMGLAVVSGLGYTAYSMSIGLAVGTQADEFLAGKVTADSGFLTRIMESNGDPKAIRSAFLLTLPPSSRGQSRVDDEVNFRKQYDGAGSDGVGRFTLFSNNMMIRMLSRGGTIESLGMRDWTHERQSFKVDRAYRLVTPEGTLNVVLEAESTEPEIEGQTRRWYVEFLRSGVESSTLTPLGHAVQELREQGRLFLEGEWLRKMHDVKPDLRAKRVAELDQSNWDALVRDTPEMPVGGKNLKRERLRREFHAMLIRSADSMPGIAFPQDTRNWPTWNHDAKGLLWIRQPFTAFFPDVAGPPMQCDGWVKMRTTEKVPLEKMTSPAPMLSWEVEEIVIERLKSR